MKAAFTGCMDNGVGNVTLDSVVLDETRDIRLHSESSEINYDHSYFFFEDKLDQLLQNDKSLANRLFQWQTLLLWLIISLLIAVLTVLIIRIS